MAPVDSEAVAATCARLLSDKKADDILVLHVRALTTLADYFVIANGRNPRQLKAMAEEINSAVGRFRLRRVGMEGTPDSGWMLVDLGDVVVHIFDRPRRQLYSLELLWGDAPVMDWTSVEPLEAGEE